MFVPFSFDLPVVVATACNTWGLLIVTVLLGYGLVEVPRSFFYASRRKYSLQHSYFKAAKLYGDLSEARGNLRDVTEVSSITIYHCTVVDIYVLVRHGEIYACMSLENFLSQIILYTVYS